MWGSQQPSEVDIVGYGRRRRRIPVKVTTVSKSPAHPHLEARMKQLT